MGSETRNCNNSLEEIGFLNILPLEVEETEIKFLKSIEMGE